MTTALTCTPNSQSAIPASTAPMQGGRSNPRIIAHKIAEQTVCEVNLKTEWVQHRRHPGGRRTENESSFDRTTARAWTAATRRRCRGGAPKRPRCDNRPEFRSRHESASSGKKGNSSRPHPSRETNAERSSPDLQRPAAGRVPECELVCESGRGKAQDRGVKKGGQRRKAARAICVSYAGVVCAAVLKAHQQDSRTGRMKSGVTNYDWQRKRGQVTSFLFQELP